VASIGFFGSQFLDRKQALDTNARLYADLMSKREESDSNLRKDMFNSIIGSFLKPKTTGLRERVLNLELLSYNFHEALDLGPLFKYVYDEVRASHSTDAEGYRHRLEAAAAELVWKQLDALQDSGRVLEARGIDFQELEAHPEGVEVMDETISLRSGEVPDSATHERHFTVWVLDARSENRELRIRLRITPGEKESAAADNKTNKDIDPDFVDTIFTASPFRFPMIDNVRLSHGWRCAIVLPVFEEGAHAEITLAYFPGSRASLKEKPYYDEVLHELLDRQSSLEQSSAK
jgi:hypothetical protein